MAKLLFVAHRYAPYPGGTEYNVQMMAEATLARGHDVTVLADTHMGDLNGVTVTSNPSILFEKWDLVLVHGLLYHCMQNYALTNIESHGNPTVYMLIDVQKHPTVDYAMEHAKYLAWGTSFDLDHIRSYGKEDKARRIRYAVNELHLNQPKTFKERHGINTPHMITSSGGFWPHKGFDELIAAFNEADLPHTTLVLFGYDNRHGNIPTETHNIRVFHELPQSEVYAAMQESDLYVMNSSHEGYGLVIIEAMANACPWIGRPTAAAYDLRDYGHNYETYPQLVELLKNFKQLNEMRLQGYNYVMNNHLLQHLADDIESMLL